MQALNKFPTFALIRIPKPNLTDCNHENKIEYQESLFSIRTKSSKFFLNSDRKLTSRSYTCMKIYMRKTHIKDFENYASCLINFLLLFLSHLVDLLQLAAML